MRTARHPTHNNTTHNNTHNNTTGTTPTATPPTTTPTRSPAAPAECELVMQVPAANPCPWSRDCKLLGEVSFKLRAYALKRNSVDSIVRPPHPHPPPPPHTPCG